MDILSFISNHRRGILGAGIGLIVLLIGWVVYYNFFTLHVTSVSPNTANMSTLTPQLVITFNKDISEENLEVTSFGFPSTTEVIGNILKVNIFSTMSANASYEVTINSASSIDRSYNLKDHSISFSPRNNASLLTDREQQILLGRQQKNKPETLNDPIYDHIPYSTLDYSIDPIINSSQEKIALRVTISPSAADARIDMKGFVEKTKKTASTYINNLEEVGIDPSKYIIVYKITEPSL